MFLDNLSTAVLCICYEQHLTYEAASERCNLSSRYFADIARRKTAPTILTLEKLCKGLEATPNVLLLHQKSNWMEDLEPDCSEKDALPFSDAVACTIDRTVPGLGGQSVCQCCGRSLYRGGYQTW